MRKKKSAGARSSKSQTKRGLKMEIGRDPSRTSKRATMPRPSASNSWDPDTAPELTEEYFERADLYHGDKLIRRGRPPSDNPKQALKLRIDADVLEHFRATGPGWQTRINDTLRRAAKLRKVG